MAQTTRRIGRRFPDYGWAWPTGQLDQLLKAALLPDEAAACRYAARWLDENDIDAADFREHRLLAAISDRFGRKLADRAAYPRLVGLQKMLWTKSRMAMREAEPVLQAMADGGIPVMLIKGASRVALDAAAQRGRVAHDIDILVQPPDMIRAFDILRDGDWRIATGVSPQYLRTRLDSLRSMNFFKGSFGDIDLHQFGYDGSQSNDEDDAAIWDRAQPARFSGVNVFIPSPADRIALAIAHGGLDAHTHSDWLVDCAAAIQHDEVDWEVFLGVCARRRIAPAAAVALSYLSMETGTPVPAMPLAHVVEMADRMGLSRWSSLLQAKPRTDFGKLVWLSRGFAKQLRLKRKKGRLRQALPDVIWRGKPVRSDSGTTTAFPVLSHAIPCPDFAGDMTLAVTVRIDAPPVRRRIEMELNLGDRHIARLRSTLLSRAGGQKVLRFHGRLTLEEQDEPLRLEARPSRQFREWNDPEIVAAYGALPFQLLSAAFSRTS